MSPKLHVIRSVAVKTNYLKFRLCVVMLCSAVGKFSASHVDHIVIVNQACSQLNVMRKNNDLIIFIVILKAD